MVLVEFCSLYGNVRRFGSWKSFRHQGNLWKVPALLAPLEGPGHYHYLLPLDSTERSFPAFLPDDGRRFKFRNIVYLPGWIVFLDIFRHPYTTAFRRLESVAVLRWKPLSWAQSIELVAISE
jgi:hypothetical protein